MHGLPGGSAIKNLPASAGDSGDVGSSGQEGPLEKEGAAHSSTLPGKSHAQRSLAGYSPQGHRKSDVTQRLNNSNTAMQAAEDTTWTREKVFERRKLPKLTRGEL